MGWLRAPGWCLGRNGDGDTPAVRTCTCHIRDIHISLRRETNIHLDSIGVRERNQTARSALHSNTVL